MSTQKFPEVTRAAVEKLAAETGRTVLETVTHLQGTVAALEAAGVGDGEATLEALCAIKRQVLGL